MNFNNQWRIPNQIQETQQISSKVNRVYMQAGRNERLPLNKLKQLDFQLISQQQKWKPED